MATLILKSLVAGYVVTFIGLCVLGMYVGFLTIFLPLFTWPATLIISGIMLLVFKTIEEN